ncbi:GumC family protein [Mycoplana ramosa]|uniref:GumC family protein n=2 Tax=Mycoplana ramosa TaxID=40837 RepID=A0ABW3Z1H1_MYCRA
MYTASSNNRGPKIRIAARAAAVTGPLPPTVRVSTRAGDWRASDPGQDETFHSDGQEAATEAVVARTAVAANGTAVAAWLDIVTIGNAFRWLLSYKLVIIAAAVFGVLLGAAFILTVPPRYSSSAELLVEPTDLNLVADDIFVQSLQRDSQLLAVESKLRLLTSGNVLARVVKDLDLVNDPEFVGPGSKNPLRDALGALEKRVTASRDTRSFLVSLSAWSRQPEKSVEILDKLIASFQDELVSAQAEGAGRAAGALTSRLETLKDDVRKAEEKVEEFKRSNGLRSSAGELASSITANQVNAQMVDARERLIRAQSRYKELTSESEESRLNAASLQSDTMTALRTQYSLIRQQITSQSAVLGPRHPELIALQPKAKALEAQIQSETRRLVQLARAELEEAQNAVDRLTKEADAAKGSVFTDTAAQVQLRQLEREAQAKASVYEAFMTRASEAAQRQQIDATNVRVVSQPLPPVSRSFPPRSAVVLAGGLVAGAIAGAFVALLLGFLREVFGERWWRRPFRAKVA